MPLPNFLRDFTNNERASGMLLIACTILSLSASNLFPAYAEFWTINLGHHSITHWINDGLMTIFFLLIGLELKQELYSGELSTVQKAALPVIAALGGMIIPAFIYFSINVNRGDTAGVGIPMATDIAFALAVLSLVGKGTPTSVKVFLTALAVIDDLGAILVIAVFYTDTLHWINLAIAMSILLTLAALNRLKVNLALPYILGGIALWYFMMGSGIHATISGVMLAFVIPFRSGDQLSLSQRLQKLLHKPVAFIILPLFALANTSIVIQEDVYQIFSSAVSIGIITGLVAGKPIGVLLFTYTAVKLKLGQLGETVTWKHITGVGLLAGIGFTMSIFISLLAFGNAGITDQAKLAILLASLVSGVIGFVFLKKVTQKSVH